MASEFRINIVIDPSSADRGVRVVERRLNQLSGQADNLRNLLGRALTGIGLAFTGRELTRLADEFTNIENKLATVTDGIGDLANKTEELFLVANRTRTSYSATVELYSRVARSAKVLGRTEEEVTKFTETLSKSLIVSGASAQEARAGLIQLSQGIASGVLRGDELRSVLEQLPYTADIIAKQLGVTRGQLREFGEQGKLSADLILNAFKNAAGEVDAAFAKTTPTLEQSFTILRNNLIKFVGETNKANGITESLSKGMIRLSENIEVVARGIIALSIALGANYFLSVMQQATSAVIRFGIALLANPITVLPTLIAAGIAALVAFGDQIKVSEGGLATLQDVALVALPKIISFFQQLVGEVMAWAGTFANTALPSIEQVLLAVADFITNTIGAFNGLMNYLGTFWDVFASSPKTAFELVRRGVKQGIQNTIAFFLAGLQTVFSIGGRLVTSFLQIIENASGAIGALTTGNLEAAQAFADNAISAVNRVGASFKYAPTEFANKLTDAAVMFQKTPLFAELDNPPTQDARDAGQKLRDAFNQGFEEAGGAGIGGQLTGAVGGARAAIQNLLKEAEARAQLRKQTQDQLETERKLAAEREKAEAAAIAAGTASVSVQMTKEQSDLYKQLTGNLQDIRKQYEDLEVLRKASMSAAPTGAEGLIRIDETTYNRALDNLTLQALESATTVEAGFQRAFANIRLEATDFASVAENSFMVLADVGTDALTKLVTEGSVNFKDLARDAIAQLAQIISRLLMMQLLSSSLGFLGFNPAAGAASAGISGAMATGGTTQPGRSYLVGERGPEVFTPGQTGVVSPNANSMASAPPQVNVQVVNVNDPNEVPSALNSGRADQAILNVLRRNRQSVQRITG